MKKILFPTDFSKTAANAFIYALQLADHFKAEIITLHVYDLPKGNYLDYYDYMTGAIEVLDLTIFQNYKDVVPQLRKIAEQYNLEHVPVSHIIDNNDFISSIRNIIEKDKIDYVVMGTKGTGNAEAFFVGSFAEKAIRKVGIPVLLIPEKAKYHSIDKIMFATRFHSADIPILEDILKIAEDFDAFIDCVYVKKHDEDIKKNQAYEAFNDYFFDNFVSTHIIDGTDVEKALLDYADTHRIDVMVMPVKHKSFFERLFNLSLVRKMAFHSHIPLLTIPVKE